MTDKFVLPESGPFSCDIDLVSNTELFRNPFTKKSKTRGRGGEHWMLRLSYRNKTAEQKKFVAGLRARLNGSSARLVCRDFSYGGPGGALSISELIDVDFNSTNWESSSSTPNRGYVTALGDGLRYRGGKEVGNVILRPTNGEDGVSGLVAGKSYAARIWVSRTRAGLGGATAGAAMSWHDANWGNVIATRVVQADLDESEILVAAATCFDTSAFFLRPSARIGGLIADTVGMSQDFSRLSAARCLLVDNGVNEFTYSEDFGDSDWTKSQSTVSTDAEDAPDASTTADELVEDSTSSTNHGLTRSLVRTSAEESWTATVFIKTSTSQRIRLTIDDGAGNGSEAYFDATLGTITSGPTDIGTGRDSFASIHDYGDGWYRCRLSSRIPATTTLRTLIDLCNGAADTVVFNGDGSSGIYIWGAQAYRGHQLGRYVATTDAAAAGDSQTGHQVWVKGLDANVVRQMVEGDQMEIDGQLVELASDLDGDEDGVGLAEIRPRLRSAPANETAVILHEPQGIFVLAADQFGIRNRPGTFSDYSLDLEEAI